MQRNIIIIILLLILPIISMCKSVSHHPELLLIKAAKDGDMNQALELLNRGVEVDQTDDAGKTPLIWAATMGHLEMVKLLVKHGANVNHVGSPKWPSLYGAMYSKNIEMVKFLINAGFDVNMEFERKITPIYEAIWNKDTESLLLLIEAGAEVNHRTSHFGTTPLMSAANTGTVECAKILINNGADINAVNNNNQTALVYALQYALREKNIEVFKFLLKAGAHPDVIYEGSRMLIHQAIIIKNIEAVHLLCEAGCDVNVRTSRHLTPLHLAAGNANELFCVLLIKSGADVNSVTLEGITPLMYACEYGMELTVSLLLENNANPNKQENESGNTALHLTLMNHHKKIARWLVSHGAKLNIKNYEGITALDIAKEKGINLFTDSDKLPDQTNTNKHNEYFCAWGCFGTQSG